MRDNVITGNRTGIDINNSNGHTIRNNVIDFNRTGAHLPQPDRPDDGRRKLHHEQLDGRRALPRREWRDVTAPSNPRCTRTFSNNNISANWYGQSR
jgi:parallel beta-helix repeat protein